MCGCRKLVIMCILFVGIGECRVWEKGRGLEGMARTLRGANG
jgi:hypothetical protein